MPASTQWGPGQEQRAHRRLLPQALGLCLGPLLLPPTHTHFPRGAHPGCTYKCSLFPGNSLRQPSCPCHLPT